MGWGISMLYAKFQLNWPSFGGVIANVMFCFVWLRFGLATFGLAKFCFVLRNDAA